MSSNVAMQLNEGSVWSVQFGRTRPGATMAYLKQLKEGWDPIMEEARRKGIVLSYRVLLSNLTSPSDWDVMLMIELKNMASLDNYRQKIDEVAREIAAGGGGSKCLDFLDPGSIYMRLVREVSLK